MFTITGMYQGRAATIRYKDGILTGDQAVIKKAQYENMQDHGYLGMHPNVENKEYLSYELCADHLLTNFVFESIISEENDWEPYDPDVTY